MRTQFVKTSNYTQLVAGIKKVVNAAEEARVILLSGEPGTGKSRCVDYHGSLLDAVYINGMPSINVTYIRELLAYELGVQGGSKFMQQKAIQDEFNRTGKLVILDEAQHGLERKADVIEYLRRIVEQAGSTLILVCHTSERHRFGEHRLAHIATRISVVVEFKTASLEDCALYLQDLCEVGVDAGIVAEVHKQSRGRYRLMTSACATLEMLGKKLNKSSLVVNDVKSLVLCEDAMQSLRGA